MKNYTVLNIQQFESHHEIREFHTNTIENHLITAHKNIHKPHKHDFYLTLFFTKGSGIHEIDFVTYEVKPGSLFFLNPGQMHHWQLSEDVGGFIFFHTQPFYDLYFSKNKVNDFPFFHSVQNTPVLYVDEIDPIGFTSLFEQIYIEKNSRQIFKMQKIIALIDLIYIESTRLYLEKNEIEQVKQNSYSNKFQELEQWIEKEYKNEKSPSQYANWLNISPKHLNRITQNMVGKTTTDLILERVFLEAKRVLISQKHSFYEVATDLGYDDYAYFSRLFKKKCGETPSDFVNRYR